MYCRDMVCFRHIIVNILHTDENRDYDDDDDNDDDDDDYNNNNNNNRFVVVRLDKC